MKSGAPVNSRYDFNAYINTRGTHSSHRDIRKNTHIAHSVVAFQAASFSTSKLTFMLYYDMRSCHVVRAGYFPHTVLAVFPNISPMKKQLLSHAQA